jgi:DMSO/TMAO reductase YedYZ molybdopterin-dependent catalytic subunit
MNAKGTPVGRRVILGMLGLGASGAAFGSRVQDGLDTALSTVSGEDPTGVTGLLPGGGGFRFYNVADSVPHRSESDYRLTVSGLVGAKASHTLAELRKMPQTRLVRDVQCVTGWRVGATPWEGVRLAHLLDLADVRHEATAVRFTCFDGAYTESLTLSQARRDDVLVALKMNGEPVTAAHGGPVRLYVAPMYFYKSAKWLSGIELTRKVEPGYWEHLGYDVDAWVGKSNGRGDDPTS